MILPTRGRGSRSSRIAGVTISAADSSTDPRASRRVDEVVGRSRLAEQGVPVERRSTRPVVRPARLQDYSEEEERRSRRRSRKRKSRSSYREEDDPEEEEVAASSRRREAIMSPKTKRRKSSAVNYQDQSEDDEEEESLSLRREAKRRKRKEEQEAAANAANAAKRKSPKKKPESRSGRQARETVSYQSEEEMEEQQLVEEDVDSDTNYGRRRGMRTRRIPAPAASMHRRPQRSTGQGSRNNYREPSTDDDLPPRRRHRVRGGPRWMEEDQEYSLQGQDNPLWLQPELVRESSHRLRAQEVQNQKTKRRRRRRGLSVVGGG